MRNNKCGWVSALAVGTLAASVVLPAVRAEVKSNPYEPIVERNAFNLKPPPPPPDPAASLPPPAPAATVKVTGFTSLFSKKKVLLEITPVGAGKTPTKPILEEGDRVESIEVVAIDVEKNQVTIKNNGVTTNLTFEVASSSKTPVPGAPPIGFVPPPNPTTTYVPPAPQPFTPTSVGGNSSGSRGGVLVVGGANAASPTAPGFGAPVTTTFGGGGGAANYGGNYGGNTPTVTGGSDVRQIPPRALRTGVDAAAQGQPPVDPAQQYINMRASELRAKQFNIPHPPTPPVPE